METKQRACFVPSRPVCIRGRRRGTAVCCSAVEGSKVTAAPFTLHTTDDSSIKAIKEGARDGRRVKEESMTFSLESDGLKFELECNPNIYPDPFSAKVYVTADDGRISISSMAMLPKLIDCVKAFKAQHLV